MHAYSRELIADTSQNAQQFPTGNGPITLRKATVYLPVNIAFVTDILEFVRKTFRFNMKLKLLPVLVALLLTIDGFGQSKSISVSIYKSGDTTLQYRMQRQRIALMKMRDPLVSKDSFLLRIAEGRRKARK